MINSIVVVVVVVKFDNLTNIFNNYHGFVLLLIFHFLFSGDDFFSSQFIFNSLCRQGKVKKEEGNIIIINNNCVYIYMYLIYRVWWCVCLINQSISTQYTHTHTSV